MLLLQQKLKKSVKYQYAILGNHLKADLHSTT